MSSQFISKVFSDIEFSQVQRIGNEHPSLFAEAFWALHRPSRSRQRNMRGCRNALEAALSDRGDAHDIVDAYEYAEKVIEDLTDGIDYLQERIRHLMQEATVHSQWEDFVEFLERFQRDYSKQLTADSATLNRQAIRQKLDAIRGRRRAQSRRAESQTRAAGEFVGVTFLTIERNGRQQECRSDGEP